jgi:glycosyltransferase involved in cell wall biosynthesis
MTRILHVLSQRPSFTGSGITLDAVVRHADAAGYEQLVVAGTPADEPLPAVAGLDPTRVRPLEFETGELDFPLPGMSDVMPYRSTVWSAMTGDQLRIYREAWTDHLATAIADFRPDLIHSHHVWLLSSLLKDIAPDTPIVTQCHSTGLRQAALCPRLAGEVRRGCARNERFAVQHRALVGELTSALGITSERVAVVGAGYRDELFRFRGNSCRRPRLVYVGKYAAAKGLPWLLDALEKLTARVPNLELHVAGSGAGDEADELRARMERMAPEVVLHGQVAQDDLAELMRRSAVCVLPSFYEGLPLVLVEGLACGCRLVATALPGVANDLAPHVGDALETVPLPRLEGPDKPVAEDLPAFVDDLAAAIEKALGQPPLDADDASLGAALSHFTWRAVYQRVESVWRELIDSPARVGLESEE